MTLKEAVFIASVPRSGSSWMGQILNSSPNTLYRFQPLFSYAFKGYLNPNSTEDQINSFYSELIKTDDPFVVQSKNLSGNKNIEFQKEEITHLIIKEVRYLNILSNLMAKNTNTKLVGIIRNPCAVLSSWELAPKEFESTWDIKNEWREAKLKNKNLESEYYGYEKWKEAALLFHELKSIHKDRVHIVKYEELVMETEIQVKKIFDFAGLPYTEQTKKFIELSTNTASNDPYGVNRKSVDLNAWRSQLNKEISNEIYEDLKNSFLKQYLDDVA